MSVLTVQKYKLKMVLYTVKHHGDASSLGYYNSELNCMSRTSVCGVGVAGGRGECLGFWTG